ncbi:MAG: hypothetical protein ABSF91_02635 [Bacteroidota bacterium]|jgi:hypothetical protein
MKKVEKAKQGKKGKLDSIFPLERENFIIIGVGLLVIVLGYIALSENKVEGFMPLVVAPLLLVLGYCVIVPIGIMYRKKDKPRPSQEAVAPPPQQPT